MNIIRLNIFKNGTQLYGNIGDYSPEQVVGHLKLREDGWEVTNSAQHLIQTISILDIMSTFQHT